jgi:hypothetical protein
MARARCSHLAEDRPASEMRPSRVMYTWCLLVCRRAGGGGGGMVERSHFGEKKHRGPYRKWQAALECTCLPGTRRLTMLSHWAGVMPVKVNLGAGRGAT